MLIELVRAAAAEEPQRAVVIAPEGALRYGDCLTRAHAVAAGLRAERIERFGSVLGAPSEIVVALVAASACGSEACLYPPELGVAEIERFAARFDHEVVLADQQLALANARAVSLDRLQAQGGPVGQAQGGSAAQAQGGPVAQAQGGPVAQAQGGSVAQAQTRSPVLILTTGTTGEPKGARHEWSRLVGAVRHPDERSGTRWLLAYNLNQFAGLQILVHVLASRGTLVAPASRQAEDVIAAIRRHRVTHASATPTLWRLVVARLQPASARELPLRQITLGGEAAPEGLIRRLGELFPEARISHVYAGTEFGSVVSVRDRHSGLPASILERDESADVRFRIVDDELQICSRVGMLGYHGGPEVEGEWRPTGDLVEVRDGRIHFVGRKSEIINVGGAKVHPLPVEEVICAVEGVELAAVYGRPNPITGQIVAADVVAAAGVDPGELTARIRAACEALPAAGRPRRIRIVDRLQIKGNKLMRREAETG